jgi:hypothetical protein
LTEGSLSIGKAVGAILAWACCENHGRRAGRLVQQRSRPTFRLLARGLPEDLAIAAVEGGNVGVRDLVGLQDDRIAGKNGRGAETHGVGEGTERHAPSNFAGRIIGDEAEILEEDVDVFAIGDRSNGGGVSRSKHWVNNFSFSNPVRNM